MTLTLVGFWRWHTSTDVNPTHEYATAGNYIVTLTAVGAGGEANASSNIEVLGIPVPLQASFAANPTSGTTPLTVTFDSSASTGSIF
ncbi:MAG UNVERIFIED_CONTAM: PKD domain-containing protein [Anaerolineae bacterium]